MPPALLQSLWLASGSGLNWRVVPPGSFPNSHVPSVQASKCFYNARNRVREGGPPDKRNVEWLESELPLVAAGILTDDLAQRLHAHYAAQRVESRLPLAFVLLAALGSVLIGLGVILILAYNWEALSRPVRTAIAFLPLLACQAMAAFVLARRMQSPAWREAAGTL